MPALLRFSVLLCLWAGVAAAQVTPQSPNLFLATPSTGTGYLGLRAIAPQDFNSGTGANGSTCLSGLMTWIACTGSSVINTGAQGQIAYYAVAGTTLSPLSAGTAGQFLQSNGAGAAPTWVTGLSLPVENGTTGYPLIHVDEATPIAGVAGGQFGTTPASYIRGISSIYTATVGNAGLGISSFVVQDGSGGFNYPTGMNAFAQLDHSGYWAFPANFICESFTHGGCVSEFDSNNWYANPAPYPEGTFPPDYSTVGLTANNYASGLQIMAGGNFDSMFGLGIGENTGTGSGTQSFIAGIYMWPAGARHYGLLIDATSTTSASYGAYIKSAAANVNLVLQTVGSEVAGNSVFGVVDAIGTNHVNIHQDGSIVTTGTLSIGGGSPVFGACGSSPSFPTSYHNNSTGVITVGTSPSGNTCTVNFSTAYANIESCIASQVSGTPTPVEIGFNTSYFTLINVVGGDNYSYACFGN